MAKSGTIQKSLVWSTGSELAVKLVVPISNMLLARLLTPDDFGVLAICNMVISFIDIFTDAGFGKYLVQHDFKNDEDLYKSSNVAFWTNLGLSVFLWILVIFNSDFIANSLGEPEYATVISIACIQLIFTSIVSIQLGLLRRKFEFKKIFVARIATALVPLIITVPLTIVTRSYWALIIGNISGSIINAIILMSLSSWKPQIFYSFSLLKKMFSFSFWSLCEALAHWLIFWVDTFIIGQMYSSYYLGLYKNSANMVMSLIGMVAASLSPVLLSVLSRMKDSKESYSVFLHIEKIVSYVLLPMGIGIYFYRDFAVSILFGKGWEEASDIIGAWVLMMVVSTIIYSFPAEAFKAKGIPKVLFFYQLSYLLFLIPLCVYTARLGFWTFVYARAWSILWQALMCVIFIKIFLNWSIRQFFSNLFFPSIASGIVTIMCVITTKYLPSTILVTIISILCIILVYFVSLYLMFRNDISKSIYVIKHQKL